MRAALDRDADRAVELISDHINKTTDVLAHYVEAPEAEVASAVGERTNPAPA
jgi:DNA-binding GntR family transcriptional regulator